MHFICTTMWTIFFIILVKSGCYSHPSVKNKGEINQHFIHRTETTDQNSKINYDDNEMLTRILFLTDNDLAKHF
jgi:hypothetical protein